MRAGILLLSLALLGAADPPLRRFAVPGAGTLSLPVPAAWVASRDADGTVKYVAPGGDVLAVGVLRNATNAPDFAAPARLRSQVESAGQPYLANAVEKTLELRELRGMAGNGYWFALTDRTLVGKKPGNDEYRVLGHGMLGVGANVVLSFSLYSQEKDTPALREAIATLSAANLAR